MAIWVHELTNEKLHSMLTMGFVTIGRGRNAKNYLQNYAGFDIETTTVGTKAYMYIWTLTINSVTIRGRYWYEFITLLDRIQEILNPEPNDRFMIFIANESFEFQFMRKHLNITDYFFLEERQPLYVIHNGFFEFRDALLITGGNLNYLAKTYTTTQKMVGDLDYDKQRNHDDALHMSEKEYKYIDNDTIILSEYAKYYFDTFTPQGFLPLTKTGILRKHTKNECKAFCKKKHTNITNIMLALFPPQKLYSLMMKWLFRGGYVHGAISTTGTVLTDMCDYDRTSSYPASLNLEYYPCTKFVKFDSSLFYDYINTKCVMAYVEIKNIEKRFIHSIESRSKIIESVNGVYDNGRLVSADSIRVFITEIDYKIYEMFYKFKREDVNILKCWFAERGQLPQYALKPMNDNYIIKSKLKMEGKQDTLEYMIAKQNVNSAYGNMVTRMRENQIEYNTDLDTYELNKQFDYTSEVKKQVLLPQWGVWCTAHSRYALLSLVYKIEERATAKGRINDVQYCDTDSMYLTHYDDYIDIIEEYNETMNIKVKAFCDRFDYDFKYFEGLGGFAFEDTIRKFKHQGAKRYIKEYKTKDGWKIKTTIAGLPKQALIEYAKDKKKDIFEIFNDKLNIPPEYAKKLCSHYNDEPHEDIVNGELMREQSSVALTPIDFTLKINGDYIEMIADEAQKRMERGVI